MKPRPLSQRGQALVLVVLAAVGLFAFAALAIDGSAVFSDRRHSQNASDTAAYAAALALARNPTSNWQQAGLERASSNGYDESDGLSKVYVHQCSTTVVSDEGITLTCQGLPADADPAEYVHVYIKSVVKLTIARIIGWQQVINHTDAVVRATPARVVPWYDGNALVATMKTCKQEAGWPHDPFTVTGNSGTTVVYSGILVNSSCNDAFTQGGSSTVTTDNGVCVVGSADYDVGDVVPAPDEDCEQIDPDKYTMLPPPTCSQTGQITEISSKNYVASPGTYTSPFPDVSQAGTLKLERGIYCLNRGLNLNSTWDITTDLDGDGHDNSEGVFFYVPDGDVTFNGSSSIDIHAVSAPFAGFDSMYINYLMYIPSANPATVTITGSNGSSFTGTILAPSSHVKLSGGSTSSGGTDDGTVIVDAQIIGFTIAIEGNGVLDIIYNQSKNAVTSEKPNLSPTE